LLKNTPIDDMLAIGAVSSRSARIWVRVSRPGRYTLTWARVPDGSSRSVCLPVDDCERDLTASVTLREGLDADCRYRVILHRDPNLPLAAGSFVTAPADARSAPQRFSIALMSCHQPFDAQGRVAAATAPMLEVVNRVFQEHQVRAVVMAGDQLYSDYPRGASLLDPAHFREVAPPGRETLLDCSAQEVRQLFHQRYRHFWNIRGWRELLAHYPCYPILDDHEIVDNWGSAEEHGERKWQAFRQGAFQAYADYQGSRVCSEHAAPPASFDYEVQLADIALYVMDLRSNRRVGKHPQLVSPQQVESFRRFMERHRDESVLFVVLSVPLVHLPRHLSQLAARVTPDGEDFSDRWSSRGHCRDRDEILRLLHEHQRRCPEQRIVLLSGDIHIGCLHRIAWRDRQPSLYQFISSGVTHDAGALIQIISAGIIRANRRIRVTGGAGPDLKAKLRLLPGEPGARRNPCGRLNVGIIEIERSEPGGPPTLRFLLYSHRGSSPHCLYRSPPIAAAERRRSGTA
jgi:alkaline phosphatase D